MLKRMKTDEFDNYGPKYLTNPDWENRDHQRIVAACLVKAAYVLENDRTEKREGGNRLAPQWWEFFGFELLQRLEDNESPVADASTIGAVFRLNAASRSASTSAPAIVIAVRGTENVHDWGVNIDTLLAHGPQRYYCKVVMQALRTLTGDHGSGSNIWLCGHSLGATVATLVGEELAMQGIFLTTFLFNPPYILFNRIKERILSRFNEIRDITGRMFGAAVSGKVGSVVSDLAHLAVNQRDKHKKEDQLQCFENLNKWDPHVYVNPKDWLCQRYMKYFEKKMKGSPTELPKRMASATLVINLDEPGDGLKNFRKAHTIKQWWEPGLRVQAKRYVMA